MTPSIGTMRKAVSNAYDSDRWRNKVAYMEAKQVIAIYYNFLEHGKFDKKKKKKEPEWVQMTIFDYISDLEKEKQS